MKSVFRIDADSNLPKNVQVEMLLRRLMRQSRYASGRVALPAEVELAKQLSLSRHTIRQAMARLVEQGLIRRQKNAGSFVNNEPVITSLTAWSSFSDEMHRRGIEVRDYGSTCSSVPADERVRRFFSLRRGSKVLRIVRLRGDAAGPIVAFVSDLHPRLGLSQDSDYTQPLYRLIEQTTGVVVRRSAETITAALCDPHQAKLLGCDPGEPLLVRERQTFDVENHPVEFCQCFYRASRFRMNIELIRSEK